MSFRNIFESSSSSYSPQPCHQFTFSQIELATQNFDESLVIGRGGFGKVYRGTITCGKLVLDAAIKRLESTSDQGPVEFQAEIEMLSNLRHCHVVSLIGYCNDGQEMILVYEYMPNGTLADHIHKCRAPLLTWVRRLKICIGAARGLDYLHTSTGIKHGVIHRDVKSSNILLDGNWAAKISDFGLSKIGPINQPSTYVNTLVRGTFGYLDPDYFQTGKLTRKSDVYAFGVVLFEVLCEKQAVDRSIDEEHWGLVTWAQDSIKEGRLEQIVDSKLRRKISPKCLKEFALLAKRCLHSHPKQRPTMAEVVVGLESILASQEETGSSLIMKFALRKGPKFMFSPNLDNSVGGKCLKLLDMYLYIVGGEDRIVQRFDYNTIIHATENFSEANKLRSARCYPTYKGKLQNGQGITVTQYSEVLEYQQRMNEASILVKLEHENVIQLLGYCVDGTKVYFVYDFAPNATLADMIFDPVCNLLDWNKLYKIILRVARVLVYLHYHAPIRIVYRNVQPGSILLDESFNPKMSGFYFATTINISDAVYDSLVSGNRGYLARECGLRGRLATKADVYSFGLLVLEAVTGKSDLYLHTAKSKRVVLTDYVGINWLEGTLSNILDPRIDVDAILMTKFVEIGLLCVQRVIVNRPTMEEVVDMLLGISSISLPVSEMRARMIDQESKMRERMIKEETEMRARMINEESSDLDSPINEDYDTTAVEEFISELGPR
ncbi:hypothetical protein QVD17_26099 [Tagetes erecta]|uniref:Protein kinase domain-containing protein n=1 Tax=Tagetes erecta TaxID=13708 RepID=A0AAD8K5Y4_TARER|nr:hypothetical protein QVD17_26099 [Tagetes erecta]